MILEAGYTKLLRSVTMDERHEISRALFLHYTIFRSKAELDQLKSGLNVLGVSDEMKSNPQIFKDYFTMRVEKLSAGL